MSRFRNLMNASEIRSLKNIWLNKRTISVLVVFSIIIWVVDGLVDYYFYFYESYNLSQTILFDVPPQGLYKRFSFILIFISFSLFFSIGQVRRSEAERREKFLNSLLTHDLRNHCQVILGYLEMLSDSPNLSEEDVEKIDNSIEATEKMLSLTNKVKTWVKAMESIDSVNLSIDEVKEKINSVTEKLNEEGSDIEYIFSFDLEGNDEVVAPPLLEELVFYLLENCENHSDCDKVRISLKEGDEVYVVVEDNGSGIPEEDWDNVFDLDYSNKPSSGGIGLYLVKNIIEIYNGNVSISRSNFGGTKLKIGLKKI